jgi:hypothetical protein
MNLRRSGITERQKNSFFPYFHFSHTRFLYAITFFAKQAQMLLLLDIGDRWGGIPFGLPFPSHLNKEKQQKENNGIHIHRKNRSFALLLFVSLDCCRRPNSFV